MAKRKQAPGDAPAAIPLPRGVATEQVVVFRVAEQGFGFRLRDVAEIVRVPRLARMPLAPPSLLGLANLRGTVLPVVGLGRLLGAADRAADTSSRVIVIDRGAAIGFAVDRIDGLMMVPIDRLSDQDAGAGGIDPELLDGVIKGEEGSDSIRLLDPDRLLRDQFSSFGVSAPRAATGLASTAVARTTQAPVARMALLSFDLGRQEYALPLQAVQEIIALPEHVSELPRPETAVLGVVTLRDRLLPLVSLRALLGMPPDLSRSERGKVVVLIVGGGMIGVVCDRTRDILRVDPGRIEPAPALLTRGEGDAEIAAICRLEAGRRLVAVLAPERLFRSELMRRLFAEQVGLEAASPSERTMADEQFIIFRLGEQDYGLPIAAVDEVARPPERMTRLPKAPHFIDGVINLRGQVVPIVDLRRRFELAATELKGSQRILVLAIGGGKTGFMVDSVSEVLKLSAGAISAAPELSSDSRLVDRVANLDGDDRMILLIDPTQLLDRVEADMLAKFDRSAAPALKAS